MRIFLYILVSLFLFSCGSNQFAKRKYTKGVYVAKRSSASSGKSKVVSDKYKKSRRKLEQSEIASHKEPNKLVKEEPIEVVQNEVKNEELNSTVIDGEFDEEENELIVEEFKNEFAPPELYDGEVLRKTKNKADSLGLAAGITAYTSLGIFFLALLIGFILFMVALIGGSSPTLANIVFSFMFYISMAGGVVALILGSISFSKKENNMALVGIIIGAIFAAILFVALLVVFLA